MSRKLIVYDNFFNDDGLHHVRNMLERENPTGTAPGSKDPGYVFYDPVIQQLFESLLATPIDICDNSNILCKTNIKESNIRVWDTEWFAVALLDDEYSDNECLKLLVDENNNSRYVFDDIEKSINSKYSYAAHTTISNIENFKEDVVVPFKNNRLILIEADLFHSMNFKNDSLVCMFLLKRRKYSV